MNDFNILVVCNDPRKSVKIAVLAERLGLEWTFAHSKVRFNKPFVKSCSVKDKYKCT